MEADSVVDHVFAGWAGTVACSGRGGEATGGGHRYIAPAPEVRSTAWVSCPGRQKVGRNFSALGEYRRAERTNAGRRYIPPDMEGRATWWDACLFGRRWGGTFAALWCLPAPESEGEGWLGARNRPQGMEVNTGAVSSARM